MRKIRFRREENGVEYIITNYRIKDGVTIFSQGKCWKYPAKKKSAA